MAENKAAVRVRSAANVAAAARVLRKSTAALMSLPITRVVSAINAHEVMPLPPEWARDQLLGLLEALHEVDAEAEMLFGARNLDRTALQSDEAFRNALAGYDVAERERMDAERDRLTDELVKKRDWLGALQSLIITPRQAERDDRDSGYRSESTSIRTFNTSNAECCLAEWYRKGAAFTGYRDVIEVFISWGASESRVKYYRTGDAEWQQKNTFYSD